MLVVNHIGNAIAIEQAFDHGQLSDILRAREMNHLHARHPGNRPLIRLGPLPIDCTFPPIPLHFEAATAFQ